MNARRAGFTLIEVLLTLVIMTGIMITVTTILTVARQSRDTIHNIQEQQLAGPAILQRLEQDLRGLYLYDRDPRHALLVQNRMLSGLEADTLDFVTSTDGLIPWRERANEPMRRADVNEVGYVLRPSPVSDEFLELYRREDYGIDDKPFQGGQYALLHDRVKGVTIRLFREDGVEAEEIESWGSDSDEYVGVPARIEIELTLELAPRLVREQLVTTHAEVTYKRVFRLPAALQKAQEVGVVPLVPRLTPPVANAPGPGNPGTPTVPPPEGPPPLIPTK
jgi:prepilin-type N-terminal cleavage/methylation domain-containing protein